MATPNKKKTTTSGLVEQVVERLVGAAGGKSGGLRSSAFARLYTATCGGAKVLTSRGNLAAMPWTPVARRRLMASEGRRIFVKRFVEPGQAGPAGQDERVSRGRRGQGTPALCPLRAPFVNEYTLEQARRAGLLRPGRTTRAGNWAIFVRTVRSSATTTEHDGFLVVCGFYDCDGGAVGDHEDGVVHMNLCQFAKARNARGGHGGEKVAHRYLCSGAFATAGAKVVVNMRSGSWNLAKGVLRRSSALLGMPAASSAAMDGAFLRFAGPMVRATLRPILTSASPLPSAKPERNDPVISFSL
jgi:hypothetical protein